MCEKFILEYEVYVINKIDKEKYYKCIYNNTTYDKKTKILLYVFCNSQPEARELLEYIKTNIPSAICRNFFNAHITSPLKEKIGDKNCLLFFRGDNPLIEFFDKKEEIVNLFHKLLRAIFNKK